MEYRIFGAEQRPPDDFKDDLLAFLHLDDEQRAVIAKWFLSTRSFELDAPSLPPSIAASTLLPDQFKQTAGVIRRLLDLWQRYNLVLEDIERDLLLLGFGPDDLSILSPFLVLLSPIKERVWVDIEESLQHGIGLPTIDDVNIVWNARPLFGGPTYFYCTADGDAPYTKFYGLTYMATLELISSDLYGRKQRTAIQLNEETFQRLLRGMKRAGEQLDILKEHTKTAVPDSKG